MLTEGEFRDHHDTGRLSDVVARIAVGTAEDADSAVQAAYKAFLSWRPVPPAQRVEKLLEAAEVLSNAADELAPLPVREHGGVLWEAQTDFALGTGVLQHTAGLTEQFFIPVEYDDDEVSSELRRCRGVKSLPSIEVPALEQIMTELSANE